jgi:hypothetical protein
MQTKHSCPLTTRQVIDEYFIENRTHILDIAAFLDRLDRSADGQDPAADYRIAAFRQALKVLTDETNPVRASQAQMIFSDRTVEPKEKLDGKSAYGAWKAATQEVR